MKKQLIFVTLVLEGLLCAQATAQPTEADIQAMTQKMIQGASQLQNCFANIDQQALEQLQQRGTQLESDVRKLCKNGNRTEAENVAMQFASDMQNNKELLKMRECGEMAQQMIPDIPFADISENTESNNTHICDVY